MRVAVAPQHINAYGDNFKALQRLRPHAVTFTEMDAGPVAKGLRQAKRQMPSYNFYSQDIGPHSQEIPVALLKSSFTHDVAGYPHRTVLLHGKVNPGTGNDRYLNEVPFSRFGHKTVILNTHWMAALQASTTGLVNEKHNQRARAMVQAYQIIHDQAAWYLNHHWEVIVTGDFNYKLLPEWTSKPTWQLWDYSPQRLFRSLGMDWREDRLDYLAISDGLRFHRFKTINTGQRVAGFRWDSDHGLMLADIRWKGNH